MTKIAFIIFLIVILAAQNSIAQEINNLVPNGDFEDVNFCFDPINNLWRVPNWSAAVPSGECSSDYYNKCQINRGWLPVEPMQKVLDQGGAAIIVYSSLVSNYREYLQSKLSSQLIANENYVVEFKINPVYWPYNCEWSINQIEVLFSREEIQAKQLNNLPNIIDTTASLTFHNNYLDTSTWYHIKGIYTASGGEEFFTIGTFSKDSIYELFPLGEILRPQWKVAYYLIDDVMVYKASDTIPKQPEPMLPNVFSPNQDGINEFYSIENLPEGSTLEVFNRWGGLVFKQAPYLNNWPGKGPNGNPLADGVYFAILTYTDQTGKVQQKKQTVHLLR